MPKSKSTQKAAKPEQASYRELKGDALAEDMQRFCKDLLAKPGAALQFLKDAGIVNSKGKLVKQLQCRSDTRASTKT